MRNTGGADTNGATQIGDMWAKKNGMLLFSLEEIAQ